LYNNLYTVEELLEDYARDNVMIKDEGDTDVDKDEHTMSAIETAEKLESLVNDYKNAETLPETSRTQGIYLEAAEVAPCEFQFYTNELAQEWTERAGEITTKKEIVTLPSEFGTTTTVAKDYYRDGTINVYASVKHQDTTLLYIELRNSDKDVYKLLAREGFHAGDKAGASTGRKFNYSKYATIRDKREMNDADVATASFISNNTISRVKNDPKAGMRYSTIKRIAKVLKCNVNDLI